MYNDSSFAEGYAIGRDSNNGYGNNAFGGDWAWWIVILLIFGWGGNGFGNGFGNNGGGMVNYELGKLATTNDVASGFSTSAIMSDLNDILLGQAGIQQTLCQGFNGINTSILTSTNQVNQGICNLGYNIQNGFNGIQHQISDCCCETQRAIDGVKFATAQQTCDLITNQNANTQRIIDYLNCEKLSSLQAENTTLKNQLSQNAQTTTLINTLRPVAQPAYITCSPYESAFGINRGGCGCGC